MKTNHIRRLHFKRLMWGEINDWQVHRVHNEPTSVFIVDTLRKRDQRDPVYLSLPLAELVLDDVREHSRHAT